jgi:hypothetical protein
MDLDDLLKELKPEPAPTWSEADKSPSLSITLSPYEVYWLSQHLDIYLREYGEHEWSEMREALTSLRTRLDKDKKEATS